MISDSSIALVPSVLGVTQLGSPHGYVPSVLGVAQLWLPHGLYQQNKNEKTEEMAQKLRACTALAEDHIPVPAPTTGGSQTPVAPASGDLLFHHTHRTENKTRVFFFF